MTILDAGGSRWTIVEETNPSGVTNVVHSGLEDYDWIMAEFIEIETSSSALVYIEIGYGATPTYVTNHYVRITTSQNQYNFTPWYYTGGATTTDKRGSWLIANPAKNFSDTGTDIQIAVHGSGYGGTSSTVGSTVGIADMVKAPISTIRYSSSAGNLQGTGAVCRTYGYR